MARAPRLYRRATSVARDFTHAQESWWLGPDHLLKITKNWFTEEYQRFAYGDIQAVIIERTPRWSVENLGGPLLLVGLYILLIVIVALALHPSVPYWMSFGVALFVILVLVALVRSWTGPRCRGYLQTAVQTVRLAPLSNARRCRRFLAKLEPRIAAAQGEVKVAEIPERFAALSAAGQAVRVDEPPPIIVPRPARPPVLTRGGWHLALFSILLLDACHSFIGLVLGLENHGVYKAGGLLLLLAWIGLMIVALTRQDHERFPGRLRILTWSTLVYLVTWFILASLSLLFMREVAGREQVMIFLSLLFSAALGALGFRATWQFRRAREREGRRVT